MITLMAYDAMRDPDVARGGEHLSGRVTTLECSGFLSTACLRSTSKLVAWVTWKSSVRTSCVDGFDRKSTAATVLPWRCASSNTLVKPVFFLQRPCVQAAAKVLQTVQRGQGEILACVCVCVLCVWCLFFKPQGMDTASIRHLMREPFAPGRPNRGQPASVT